jgi:hypothetical protein
MRKGRAKVGSGEDHGDDGHGGQILRMGTIEMMVVVVGMEIYDDDGGHDDGVMAHGDEDDYVSYGG